MRQPIKFGLQTKIFSLVLGYNSLHRIYLYWKVFFVYLKSIYLLKSSMKRSKYVESYEINISCG